MSIWNDIKHVVSSAGHSVVNTASSAWDATSQEGKEVAGAIAGGGLPVGPGLVSGAKIAAQYIEEGGEVAGKGLVTAGDYVSSHSCDIALGSLLSGTFVALAADGEEEAAMGALAVASAIASTVARKAAIATAAHAIAAIVATPIYALPPVRKALAGVPEANFEAVLEFVITKAVTEDPELVVGSAGQVVAGLVIATVTSIVCEGKVPAGGPQLWAGAQ